jgi:hypothetical protein
MTAVLHSFTFVILAFSLPLRYHICFNLVPKAMPVRGVWVRDCIISVLFACLGFHFFCVFQ